jgi:hypothetical protein
MRRKNQQKEHINVRDATQKSTEKATHARRAN